MNAFQNVANHIHAAVGDIGDKRIFHLLWLLSLRLEDVIYGTTPTPSFADGKHSSGNPAKCWKPWEQPCPGSRGELCLKIKRRKVSFAPKPNQSKQQADDLMYFVIV